MTITALLTDIEGTTTSVDFVKDTLFPYARARLADFVAAHGQEPAVRAILDEVAASLTATHPHAPAAPTAPCPDNAQIIATLHHWMDTDRKAGPLKALQGLIWETGYATGDFVGHVYPDAHAALGRWHRAGIALHIYSSGSAHAQGLLFGHTEYGDLRPWFQGYFDTTVGPKQDTASYQRIVATLQRPAAQVLFLSDVTAELDAAATAGLRTCQVVRPATTPGTTHPVVRDFSEIFLG